MLSGNRPPLLNVVLLNRNFPQSPWFWAVATTVENNARANVRETACFFITVPLLELNAWLCLSCDLPSPQGKALNTSGKTARQDLSVGGAIRLRLDGLRDQERKG